MIKVIKPGYKKEIECPKCGAVLTYDEKEDVETQTLKTLTDCIELGFYKSYKKYITCPQCKHEIILNQTR